MWPALQAIAQKDKFVYVEGIYDTSGAHGVYLFFPSGKSFVILEQETIRVKLLEQLFSNNELEKVVFGFRSLVEVGLDKVTVLQNITDVEILYGCSEQLPILVRNNLSEQDYVWLLDATSKFEAHIKAANTSLIPLDCIAAYNLMPSKFFETLYKIKAIRTLALRAKRPQNASEELMRLAIVLSRVERDGYVDADKFIHPSFNVFGGRTRRIATRKNSVACMSIPHGERRKTICSRFSNGIVCSMDFNAIDYRCIVASDDKLKKLYGDCNDFHEKTVEILTGKTPTKEIRDIFKALTYAYFYGGSKETCQKATGLSMDKVQQALKLFDDKLGEVKTFASFVEKQSIRNKFGFNIDEQQHDLHTGAKLALYAQTCSSHVFKHCVTVLGERLHNEHFKTKIMFTVHDEVLLDVHEDEVNMLQSLKETMEYAAESLMKTKFVIKVKTGKNYEEAT